MFHVLRIAALVVFALGLLVFVGVGFAVGWPVILGPKARPVTDRKFEATPERLEHGRYLVEAVSACMKCHSPLDLNQHGAPPVEGMRGAGAVHNGPGRVVASNITPDRETGMGAWTDDGIARAIREGIGRDGRTLFPMMPYHRYREMSDEDIASVVVYLRSLAPVRNQMPKTEIIFPVKYLIRTYPRPVETPVTHSFGADTDRGRYLVAMAACEDCHTTFDDKRMPVAGLAFAGGNVMTENEGTATVGNITPHASGIRSYTKERFREVMRTGQEGSRRLHPLMPYHFYRNLTDEDLDAIFAFLQTVKPVKHWVGATDDVSMCPVCNMEHGMAAMNAYGD